MLLETRPHRWDILLQQSVCGGSCPSSIRNECGSSHVTQSRACNSRASLACLHKLASSTLEKVSLSTWRRVKNASPPVSGMIQPRVILPWTACHTWSTGSLCGPSVATYGVAACQDGRKPCHILYTGKSFLNGNCVHVSWPRIAEQRKMEFIQKRRVCGKIV